MLSSVFGLIDLAKESAVPGYRRLRARYVALGNQQEAAEEELLAYPAPDLAALLYKLELLKQIETPPTEHVLADARRLIGRA
jgi:hypothetical protein